MSIPTIPTATEVKARIVAFIEAETNQTTPDMAKSFSKVLAGAIAGLIVLMYQAIFWVYRQIFPSMADDDSLELLGSQVDVERISAIKAVLEAEVPGTEGTSVPTGTYFRSSSSEVYKVTTSGEVDSTGIAEVTLTAVTAGEAGSLATGSELDIVSPITGLTGTAEITSTTTSGDDEETIDLFRVRVANGFKKRRTGGSPADYESWGLEAPNFDWVSPLDSDDLPGDIILYAKVDDQTDGIPTDDQLTELENYCKYEDGDSDNGRTRHPIGPPLTAYAITRFEFDVIVYLQDGTDEIQDNIETAITSYIEEDRYPYNEAISSVRIDTISEGGISSAANDVAEAADATVTSIILSETDTGTVITSYELFGGEWGKVGTITFEEVT